jgi:Flp pilus assembly protein TadD
LGWLCLLATSVFGAVAAGWAAFPVRHDSRSADRLLLAKVAFVDRRWDAAEELLRGVIRDSGSDRSARVLLARVHLERGRAAEALEGFETVLRELPEDPEALRGAAGALRLLGRTEGALAKLRRALSGTPGDAALWRDLGLLHQERGEGLDAVAAFRKSLDLDPQQSDLGLRMAEGLADRSSAPAPAPLPRGPAAPPRPPDPGSHYPQPPWRKP